MAALMAGMTTRNNSNDPAPRRETGNHNASEEIRRIAKRLHNLEKEAAVLASELLNSELKVRDTATEPRVPALGYTVDQVAQSLSIGTSLVWNMLGTTRNDLT